MENQDNLIDLLNGLIIVNNDRVEGYEHAASEAKSLALKGLFEAMARDSRTFASELAIEVAKMGGKVATTTSSGGDLYRIWMGIKATLTGNDRKAILTSCEEGEYVAQASYNRALEAELELPAPLKHLLLVQKGKLQEGLDAIVKLRDTVYA